MTLSEAIRSNDVYTVDQAISEGQRPTSTSLNEAVKTDNPDIVDMIINLPNTHVDLFSIQNAVKQDNVEILKILYDHMSEVPDSVSTEILGFIENYLNGVDLNQRENYKLYASIEDLIEKARI